MARLFKTTRTLIFLGVSWIALLGHNPAQAADVLDISADGRSPFSLYNRCTGLNLLVGDMSRDADRMGLTQTAVVAAVESRLRGARLMSDESTGEVLSVGIQVMALRTGREVVFLTELSLDRFMEDNGFGRARMMTAWSDGSIGISDWTDQFVMGSLSKVIDRFVSSYLRANGAVCRMKERNDFDSLLALEGITLERYRRELPNATDHQRAQMAWFLGGHETGLEAAEFCRQFLELPKDGVCPIKDFGTIPGTTP